MMDNPSKKEENDAVWQTLPLLVLENVFRFLPLEDICRAGGVCRSWHEAARHSLQWNSVILNGIQPLKIMKLISHLPPTVRHLHLICDSGGIRHKKFALLFPEVMSILAQNCPSLSVLILEDIRMETRIRCRRLKNNKENKKKLYFLTNHNLDNCCEWNYCSRYEIHIPPLLKVLSFRDVFTRCENFSFKIENPVCNSLKVLELRKDPRFEYISYRNRYSKLFQEVCLFSNLEEFYATDSVCEFWMLRKVIKCAKNLRFLSCPSYVDVGDLFRCLKKYKPPLEELCLSEAIIRDTDNVTRSDNTFLSNLRSLCLRCSIISISKLREIRTFYPHLENIDLHHTQITEWDIRNDVPSVVLEARFLRLRLNYCDHFKERGHYDP